MKKSILLFLLIFFLASFSFSYQIDKGKELKVVTFTWNTSDDPQDYKGTDEIVLSYIKAIGEEKVLDTSLNYIVLAIGGKIMITLTIIYQE